MLKSAQSGLNITTAMTAFSGKSFCGRSPRSQRFQIESRAPRARCTFSSQQPTRSLIDFSAKAPTRTTLWRFDVERDLSPKISNDTALVTAEADASKINIRMHPKRHEWRYNFGVGALATLGTAFLAPWWSIPVGLGVTTVSTRVDLGRRLAKTFSVPRRLRQLALYGPPGRLDFRPQYLISTE